MAQNKDNFDSLSILETKKATGATPASPHAPRQTELRETPVAPTTPTTRSKVPTAVMGEDRQQKSTPKGFKAISTRVAPHVFIAIKRELVNIEAESGKACNISDLTNQLYREWLATRGIKIDVGEQGREL